MKRINIIIMFLILSFFMIDVKAEKPLLKDIVLGKEGGIEAIKAKEVPTFSQMATTKEGMYSALDNYGTSYYYRGIVDNNYVSFAGHIWKIVRITGSGSTKLIYRGKTSESTGLDTVIGKTAFRASGDTLPGAVNYNTSLVKILTENWYQANILDKGYNLYVSDDGFCYDTTKRVSALNNSIYYGAFDRSKFGIPTSRNKPILTCPERVDNYTKEDTALGNGLLNHPIGLLTFDEYYMAGSDNDVPNTSYYLGFLDTFEPRTWTMSPNMCDQGKDCGMFASTSNGATPANKIDLADNFVRPSIHLKNDIKLLLGDGTKGNPYQVGYYTGDELMSLIDNIKNHLIKNNDVNNDYKTISTECMNLYNEIKGKGNLTSEEIDNYMNSLQNLSCNVLVDNPNAPKVEVINPKPGENENEEVKEKNPTTGLGLDVIIFVAITLALTALYVKQNKKILE